MAVGLLCGEKDRHDISPGKETTVKQLISVIEIVGGILFLAAPGYIVSVYYVFAGIIILLSGLNNLTVALEAKKAGVDKWGAAVLLSLLAIIAGLIIILNPFSAAATVVRFIGIALAYEGIVGLLLVIHLASAKK